MSAIIRLRPNRIVLTSDEVHNLHPRSADPSSSGSTPSPAAILAWDHNITRRRARARASRRHCAEALDLYAPELEEGSDGSVKILEDEDVMEEWSGGGGGEGDGREGVALEGNEDILILPFADVGVGGVRVEEGGTVQRADSDSGNATASASASGSGSGDPALSATGAGGVDDASHDFIDIAYLADIDFDPPDSPLPTPPTTEAYLDGATAALASLDISTLETTTTGAKTPTSLRRFAERESSSPGDGVSGLSPRHKAVERKRLARYRDRSRSVEGAHLRRFRTTAGGFDGDDEKSDSDNDGSSEDHDDDSDSPICGEVDKKGMEDVDAGTQTEKVEEGEPAVAPSKKGEGKAAATTKRFRQSVRECSVASQWLVD
ncbi:unnamed protein product [Tuber aestivum]|uniref:Uncharacterized protein n=1 Tax=Tuber aestivum TaxID=59557 RepID=A0A292PHL2_9PEZI|nr:unnamed protein product [Tuber aestivum]